MTSQQRNAIPVLYAIAIVATAMLGGGAAVGFVTVIGAMLVGLAYTVIPVSDCGRERHRERNRT